jgi:hypothetical protein
MQRKVIPPEISGIEQNEPSVIMRVLIHKNGTPKSSTLELFYQLMI